VKLQFFQPFYQTLTEFTGRGCLSSVVNHNISQRASFNSGTEDHQNLLLRKLPAMRSQRVAYRNHFFFGHRHPCDPVFVVNGFCTTWGFFQCFALGELLQVFGVMPGKTLCIHPPEIPYQFDVAHCKLQIRPSARGAGFRAGISKTSEPKKPALSRRASGLLGYWVRKKSFPFPGNGCREFRIRVRRGTH